MITMLLKHVSGKYGIIIFVLGIYGIAQKKRKKKEKRKKKKKKKGKIKQKPTTVPF